MERGLAFRDLYLYQPNVSKRVIDSFSEGADALEGRLDGHEGRLGNQRKESFPHHISWEIRNGNGHSKIIHSFSPPRTYTFRTRISSQGLDPVSKTPSAFGVFSAQRLWTQDPLSSSFGIRA